jgi:hypothetical protein
MKKNNRVPLNNKFFDMSDLTEKEVSLKYLYVHFSTSEHMMYRANNENPK